MDAGGTRPDLKMTASAHFTRAIIRVLCDLGWDDDVATAAIHHDLSNDLDRIPLEKLVALYDLAERDLNDPQVGLRSGYKFRIASYGQTGSLYAHARDLPDVIALNSRYQKLAIDIGDIHHATYEGCQVMEITPYFDDLERYRHVSAMVMGAYATAYQWLSWGSGEDVLRVDLPFSESEGASALSQKLFNCDVRFGCHAGRLAFSDAAMAQSLPTANEEKRAITVAQLDQLLGTSLKRGSQIRAIRAAIKASIEAGSISVALLAERLDMSEPALRDTLSDAGTSYRAELDDVRRELLKRFHEDGMNFATIAIELGYNDQSAFNRAMKRWYGVSPGKWHPEMSPLV